MRTQRDVILRESTMGVRFCLGVSALALLILASGCTSELGILECQQLSEPTAQYVDLPVSAESYWQSVDAKVSNDPTCSVLSKSKQDRLLSWCERVTNWRDLGQDSLLVAQTPPLSGMASQRKMEKQVKKGLDKLVQPGTAITTIWVQPLGAGCRVNIRRTYYGPGSVAGVGHSRGDYEREFLSDIASSRGS